MMRPIGGFSNLESGIGDAFGQIPGAKYKAEADMAMAANRARTHLKKARMQADAQVYQGEQAGNAAQFQGIMGAVGSIGGSLIGGLGKLGQSGGSGTAWGMSDQAGGYSWGTGNYDFGSSITGSDMAKGLGNYSFDASNYANAWKPDKTQWSSSLTGW